MDQNEMQREIQRQFQLMLNYCFGMMNDPEKLYIIQQCGLGDIIINGGLAQAVVTKFKKRTAVLMVREQFRSLDVSFDGVDEVKFLPWNIMDGFCQYLRATKQYVGPNFIYGHFRRDAKDKFIMSKELGFVDQYRHDVFELPLDAPFRAPIVKDISAEAQQKLERAYVLDPNRTVILAPYANSTKLLNSAFWLNLVEQLNRRGYVIYTNVGRNRQSRIENPLPGTRPMFVSLNEIFHIMSRVKSLIALRSGLLDLLVFSKGNIICLSPHTYRSSNDLKLIFPQSSASIRTLYFDFALFPKINALIAEHDLLGMQLGAIKHKYIPDGNIFWSEDALLAAILRAVDAK